MKQRSSTFLLSSVFRDTLHLEQLKAAKAMYYDSFITNSFSVPKMEALAFMFSAKRDKITFGPYQNLTFFEIGNRIYSDLLLLEAASQLFENYNIKSIQLKMSNHSGNDLIVVDENNLEIIGEGFNTANSYFKVKLRNELKKFSNNRIGIIAFNKSALVQNEVFFENKKNQYPNIIFIVCEDDTINSIM